MTSPSLKHRIDAVRAAVDKRPPFCTGSVELDRNSSLLYYTKQGSDDDEDDDEAGLIYLSSSAKVERLQELTDACFPVSFGQKNEPEDGWAGKFGQLDCERFATKFDLKEVGIVDLIRECLLDGIDQEREIEVEMEELNVYDQGSFFQEHADTPGDVDEDCLVYNLYYKDTLTTTDEGKVIKDLSEPILDRPSADNPFHTTPILTSIPDEILLRTTLTSLLQDRHFLPRGGFFGFGLSCAYPILNFTNTNKNGHDINDPGTRRAFENLLNRLIGTDAFLKQVCESLSLPVELQIAVGPSSDECGLFSYRAALGLSKGHITGHRSSPFDELVCRADATPVYEVDYHSGASAHRSLSDLPYSEEIIWITPRTEFITWGHGYADVCLVARVGRPKEREHVAFEKTFEEWERDKEERSQGEEGEDNEDSENQETDE
ncbi:hypothetical protein BDN72DRAFT_956258 [Pluteus cervinus]|uniref:Uncharacterized protein n=1 Tax=Pluteus cervinus TaxID=181527 RepID=A0ACD3B9L4_9AGAR|nr:hypothetical protein BDN72DRAFT_956258 [Pluteus cervinus]